MQASQYNLILKTVATSYYVLTDFIGLGVQASQYNLILKTVATSYYVLTI